MKKIGKDQTYSRVLNTLSIIDALSVESLCGVDLKNKLSLSSATISSILKELSSLNLIKVSETSSIYGKGRKRVIYSINEDYGLMLCINISNYHAKISLSNLQYKIIKTVDIKIEKYDSSSIYFIILEATKLIMSLDRKQPILNIIISVPGRVNKLSNELLLSKQFEETIIKDNFISKMFKKQLGEDVPVRLINDINLSAIGEQLSGQLKDVDNAIYLSIDYGIGGSLIINKQLFDGDKGYAGEFGLVYVQENGQYLPIDEIVSLRVLLEKASKMIGKEINRDELFDLYQTNQEIKNLVLESASTLGKAIRQVVNVLDISTIVLAGRIANFDKDYLDTIINELKNSVNVPKISFSKLKDDGEVIGAAYLGVRGYFEKTVFNRNEKK